MKNEDDYLVMRYYQLLVFNELTEDLLKEELRLENVYMSRKTVTFIRSLLKKYSTKHILYILVSIVFLLLLILYKIVEEHYENMS